MLRYIPLIYIVPLALLPFVRDMPTPPQSARRTTTSAPKLPGRFYILIVWGGIIAAGAFVANMTRSLVMAARGFSATAISSTAIIGGLVALAVRPGVGWLSDRLSGRRMLLTLSALAVAGRLILAGSGELWQFWMATVLMTIAGTRIPVASAMASEMVPAQALGRAMSQVEMAGWVGGAIGYAVAGHAIAGLGTNWTLVAAAVSAAVAALLLLTPALRSVDPPVCRGVGRRPHGGGSGHLGAAHGGPQTRRSALP